MNKHLLALSMDLASALAGTSALANTGTLNFEGKITSSTCPIEVVNPEDGQVGNLVKMGSVEASRFTAIGQEYSGKRFGLRVSAGAGCGFDPSGNTAAVTFNGTADASGNYFAVTPTADGAKNVVIVLKVKTGAASTDYDLNDNDVEIRYAYDALRRVIRETVAPGKPSEAFRRYEYSLCASTGDQAEQRLFDVKQVKTCTKFDGLNRAIDEERDDADTPGRASMPRQTYDATYDAWGNLVKETQYDWLGEKALALTSSLEYDDWGQQRCVTGPDGVKTFEETDPIGTDESKGPIQRSWREGVVPAPKISGVTETWLNLFEKPTRTQIFDLNKKAVSLQQYQYDGLGRTVKEVVGFPDLERVTLYSYDAFDRMMESTLPGDAMVRRSYAAHSGEDLPTSISVDNIVLGEQVFDGLDRMTDSITGGRKQFFTFEPGQTQPKTVTTPSGQVIEYDYQLELGTEPTRRRLPRVEGAKGEYDEAEYAYDPKNARLLFCEEQGLQLTREYFSTGELKSELRVVEGGEYTMHYRYSRLGRLLGYTDVLKQEQSYRYDAQGRLEYTKLGTTASTFTYDSLGQTATIHTSDSGSGQSVGIALTYDEFGRETLRSFDLDGVKQELSQVYNDVDGLKQRTLSQGSNPLRDELYEYDLRGRLTNYTCTGPQPPIDPYGKAIAGQLFAFDALDNLTLVMTTFEHDFNRARYTYGKPELGQDPAQLLNVANSHADYPALINLTYNLDGHLVSDEVGRRLEYDALGRLTHVSGLPGETPGSYRYDPLDTVVGQGDEQRFYQDGELATRIQGAQRNTVVRANGNVLAEHQEGADPKHLMLASDHKSSVLWEVSQAGRKDIAYTAYGEASVGGSLGYNGEVREAQTGLYLLGNGYRAYSPGLMRFHSPDSLSPFGKGGVNSYMFCGGNPADYVDPTGNWRILPMWLTKLGSRLFGGTAKAGAKTASAGIKTSTPAAKVAKAATHAKKTVSKGPVEGRIKGGFWDDQSTGVFKSSIQPKEPIQLPASSSSSGVKGGRNLLENPTSGAERLQQRMKEPWLKEGVVDGLKSGMPNEPAMFKSGVQSAGKHANRTAEELASVRGAANKR